MAPSPPPSSPPYLDTVEGETAFFRALVHHRPLGPDKHWAMLGALLFLKNEVGENVEFARIPKGDVWRKYKELYDIPTLESQSFDEGASDDTSISSLSNTAKPKDTEAARFGQSAASGSGRNSPPPHGSHHFTEFTLSGRSWSHSELATLTFLRGKRGVDATPSPPSELVRELSASIVEDSEEEREEVESSKTVIDRPEGPKRGRPSRGATVEVVHPPRTSLTTPPGSKKSKKGKDASPRKGGSGGGRLHRNDASDSDLSDLDEEEAAAAAAAAALKAGGDINLKIAKSASVDDESESKSKFSKENLEEVEEEEDEEEEEREDEDMSSATGADEEDEYKDKSGRQALGNKGSRTRTLANNSRRKRRQTRSTSVSTTATESGGPSIKPKGRGRASIAGSSSTKRKSETATPPAAASRTRKKVR